MGRRTKKRSEEPVAGSREAGGGRSAAVAGVGAALAVTWISHYWLSGDFGLYEDDYHWPVAAMEMSAPDLFRTIGRVFAEVRDNMARPVLDSLMYILSVAGFNLGGLRGMYFVSFLVVGLNTALAYGLGWSLTRRHVFAFAAALAFTLYPADTTQAYLMHSFGLQPSLSFLLVALILWARGRRVAAYPVAFLCLLTYEAVYPVFLAAPFLTQRWDRKLPVALLRHGAIAGGILAVVSVGRILMGEGRVARLSMDETVAHVWHNVMHGPFVALREWMARPWSGLGMVGEYPVMLFAAAVMVLAFIALAKNDAVEGSAPTSRRRLADLALAGVVMLPVAYLLTLTVPAEAVAGRASRVHIAAVVGCGLLAASAVTVLYDLAQRRRAGVAALLLAAVFFTGAAGARLEVQESYREAWLAQRALWSDILRLCPDAGPDTVILLEPNGFKVPREASVIGWNVMDTLDKMFRMPEEWGRKPIVAALKSNWKFLLGRGTPLEECIFWMGMDGAYVGRLDGVEYVLLEPHQGRLRRLEGDVEISGVRVRLKERGEAVLPGLGRRPLHGVLVLGEGEAGVRYLQ